ncbi:peptidoglycan DD-metalloendopeptidase family protein [Lachnoclostridium sp.]|uniref:peptidoglycan DD-metalloendopeptidase family protein n=1 Tax=Lachnoclostridium sp. TaxID=2028282 RepID=UPI00289E146E|nr:peptidoglycan DD-metalloendopeptidase family protein [Lachnoclostridium sp.]
MKKRVIMQATTLFIGLFLWNQATMVASAKDTSSAKINTENTLSGGGIGGMSMVIDNYYDARLSETGISINNVTTTILVGGEPLAPKEFPPIQFQGLAIANVDDYVNIRSGASSDSSLAGRLYRGSAATIVGVEGDWTKIVSGKVEGYIKSDYLSTGDNAVKLAQKCYVQYAQATCTTLNVRTAPSENSPRLGQIAKGEKLEILEILDEWVKVDYNETDAYVSKSYVDFVYNFKYAKSMDEIKTDINCMIWPLPSDHNIYAYYGYRKAPTAGASTYHKGLDIGGAYGSSIVSVLAGRVVGTGYNSTSGRYVEIDHGNGVETRYLHCSKILVNVGDYVDQGQTIALVGSTGVSTGPHLHFSLLLNGNNVNPYPYLKSVH